MDSPLHSEEWGRQIEMSFRHFTRSTRRVAGAAYTEGMVSGFDVLVVLNRDYSARVPPALLADIASTSARIMWIGRGFDVLPAAEQRANGFTVTDISNGSDLPLEGTVDYAGTRYDAALPWYARVDLVPGLAHTLVSIHKEGADVPFVVAGSRIWYVNGEPMIGSDAPDSPEDVPVLILADILHDFLGIYHTRDPKVAVRLEDVSVHVDPDKLRRIADYLYSEHVPYVIGLIPNQRFADGSIHSLDGYIPLVRALRYAQDHGATIALHGFHHTFGTGEDFEFWDGERQIPLSDDNWNVYEYKVLEGTKILRDLGLEPRLWETPHYAGSLTAYSVFAKYYSYATENRDPLYWKPYVYGPDDYGQMIIPEALGYIAPREGRTVAKKIEHAHLLKIVRDAYSVVFYHPSAIDISYLKDLIPRLRAEGFGFADVRKLDLQVHVDYQPDWRARATTWIALNSGLNFRAMDRSLATISGWVTLLALSITALFAAGLAIAGMSALRSQTRLYHRA